MNFVARKKILAYASFVFLLLTTFACKPSPSSEFWIHRFTDDLSEESVIDSPLKGILKDFKSVKEDFTGRWTSIRSLSSGDQHVWAVSSRYPILGLDESQKPEGMILTKDGREFDFIGESKNKDNGWGWLSSTKRKKLRRYEGFSKRRGGIILREGDSFRLEELLPDGEIKVVFHISEINAQGSKPGLAVTFNEKLVKDLNLDKPNVFTVQERTQLGEYGMEFKHVAPDESKLNRKNFIVLKSVRIISDKDIILLIRSGEEEKTPPPEKYEASYLTYFSESPGDAEAIRKYSLFLYQLSEKYPIRDLGIKKNPYSIIKKARIGEYSLNCLFAQPKSQFEFEVKIPENGYLEFGYGALPESLNTENNEVRFTIEIEQKQRRETLFTKIFQPTTEPQVFYEKVNLDAYKKKKAKIYFKTETVGQDQENISEINNTITVWVNPVLFRKNQKKEINFILLSIDTLRPDHLGCYGYEKKTSPHLDALSEDSIIFKNTFSTTSWTLPAHVSLLTSMYTPNHLVNNSRQRISSDIPTLADIFRNNDFLCVAFTGGGFLSSRYGFSKGFDSYQELRKEGGDYSLRIDEAEALYGHISDWLDRNHEKRFFLFLHTYQPHTPYENNSEQGKMFLDENAKWERIIQSEIFGEEGGKYQTVLSQEEKDNVIALYDGEIRYTDEYLIKPMIKKLKDLEIYDNSMIIITSDHGEEFYEHQTWLHGVNLYNESLKVPLIIKFPNSHYRGERNTKIVSIVDIMPTMLEVAEIKTSSFPLDGKSLLDILDDEGRKERTFYADLNVHKFKDDLPSVFATNRNNFKLILNKKIRSAHIKNIISDFKGRKIELYDLQEDKEETKNIARRQPYRRLCVELIQRLEAFYDKLDESKAESIIINEELKRNLRALGYIR